MTEHISQRELRNDSARIMRAPDEGRSFMINRNGRAVGELRPLRKERLIDAAAATALFRTAPGIDSGRWRYDLDAVADPGIDLRD